MFSNSKGYTMFSPKIKKNLQGPEIVKRHGIGPIRSEFDKS